MFNMGNGNTGDFEAMARQYWSAWGEAMRQSGLGPPTPPQPQPAAGWQQAVDWWSQLLPRGASPAHDAVARFNQQARDWYGQMQQVAAQFAGRDSSASEVGQAWRQALGAQGANPFPEMFKSMAGKGLHGLDDWIEQARPFLDNLQQESQRWLHLPAFGQRREHQERLQSLLQAQLDHQKHNAAFNALMATCAQRAFEVFESRLSAMEAPGQQVTTARGLFDLWVDAAEEAYAEIALSQQFRELSGALTNAQMRLRAGIQREVELMAAQWGLPTRTEVDSAHRKIADLERAVRRAGAAKSRPAAARPAAARAKEEEVVAEAAPARPPTRRKRSSSKTGAAAKSASASGTRTRTRARKAAAGKQPARKAAARKRAARPATVQEQAPARRSKAKSARPAPSAKARVAKASPGASSKAAPPPATARGAAAGKAVSMKDWVARNSAANTPKTPARGRKDGKQ